MDEFLGQNTHENEKTTETNQSENQGLNTSPHTTSQNTNFQQNGFGQNGFGQNNPTLLHLMVITQIIHILLINLMVDNNLTPHLLHTLHKPLRTL